MAYDQLDPFGDPRADWRAGNIAATVANVNRDPDKRRQPFTPQDFMPDFNQVEKPRGMSPEDMLALVRFYMPPMEIPMSEYDEYEDGDFDTNEA